MKAPAPGDPITCLGEAREVIADAVRRVQAAGFEVNGWDDGSIYINVGHGLDGRGTTYVDPSNLSDRPSV